MTSQDRALLLECVTVATIVALACLFAQKLVLMSVLVPAVIVVRMFVFHSLPDDARRLSTSREAIFFAICIVLGAFNDWNTVVRHHVYAYTVPSDLGRHSTIPAWMLLAWGPILRFMAELSRWPRLGTPDGRTIRGGALRVLGMLLLVLVTRQTIYRWWAHPIASWAPFAIALVAYFVLFRPGTRGLRLAGIVMIVGPTAESILVNVAGLHRYALGWFFGVPLWIVLWWITAALIWGEISLRIERSLGRDFTVDSSDRARARTC